MDQSHLQVLAVFPKLYSSVQLSSIVVQKQLKSKWNHINFLNAA